MQQTAKQRHVSELVSERPPVRRCKTNLTRTDDTGLCSAVLCQYNGRLSRTSASPCVARASSGITFWADGRTMDMSNTSETGSMQLSFVHSGGFYSPCLLVSCTSSNAVCISMCKGNHSQLIFELRFHLHVFPMVLLWNSFTTVDVPSTTRRTFGQVSNPLHPRVSRTCATKCTGSPFHGWKRGCRYRSLAGPLSSSKPIGDGHSCCKPQLHTCG